MTALIWMLIWLPQVLSAMSELLPPVNVSLTSNHFIHTLKWAPAPGTPTGVYYQVTSNTNKGASLVPVAGCERVQHPLVCDLTETFSNAEETYLTQVTAHLKTQASQPFTLQGFQPNKDTHLDLPLLTVTPCDRDLCVDLQPHVEHLRDFYNKLTYELRIKSNNADRAQFFKKMKSLERVTLKDLAPGRQYCVSVRISDNIIHRESNYSRPQCAFTPGGFAADAWISGVLCFLVISGVVVLAGLVCTGFISLKRRPLPLVLTINHIEEVLVFVPSSTVVSSLLNFKATLPSSGRKRNSQTPSDESDGEGETETTAGSKGGGYKLRVGTNLLCSSSSSSSCMSAPLSLEPVVPPSLSSNPNAVFLPSHFFSPQPEALVSAAESDQARSAHTASLSDPPPASQQSPPADTHSLTVERTELKEEEEEEEVGDVCIQHVNLLTLTFGRCEEKEEEEKSHLDISEVEPESPSTTLILPSQTVDVAIETISCSVVEEEEEEELSAYMRRPVSDVLQNLL